jgi:hypothetical protein
MNLQSLLPAVVALLALSTGSLSAAETAPASGSFRFDNVSQNSLGLWEGSRPVLVYNHGIIRKEGVPADRARSSYIHPLYGLDGEVLTDDFPKDHYHHRGLFWSWPHVQVGDQQYDLWMLKGIEHRFQRWLANEGGAGPAVLGIENGWYVGAKRVMLEQVWVRVHPASASERAIDLEFTWTPQGQPIQLTGAEGKSYGGLTLRFAPGTNTAITIPAGLTSKDLPMTNLPWADLTRLWTAEKTTSGAAVFVHPDHPDFPPEWLTRHYGVLCLGWPGVKPATFQPDQPIRCRYRVWLHRGAVDAERLGRAFEVYRGTKPAEGNR